ncbi:glycosyltransferase family 2 protein, partial [Klebsiella pneumoniae]|nr:glycosyltransferase family 2 protein [Klebsiella pneumoniae]
GQTHVREAVEGILAQTFRDFEFVIVDDGSTDGTARVLDEYVDPRIVRLKHESNRGLIAALNTGLAAARGEFVARQDA